MFIELARWSFWMVTCQYKGEENWLLGAILTACRFVSAETKSSQSCPWNELAKTHPAFHLVFGLWWRWTKNVLGVFFPKILKSNSCICIFKTFDVTFETTLSFKSILKLIENKESNLKFPQITLDQFPWLWVHKNRPRCPFLYVRKVINTSKCG